MSSDEALLRLALLVLWIYGVVRSWKSSALLAVVSFCLPPIGMIAGFIALFNNGKA